MKAMQLIVSVKQWGQRRNRTYRKAVSSTAATVIVAIATGTLRGRRASWTSENATVPCVHATCARTDTTRGRAGRWRERDGGERRRGGKGGGGGDKVIVWVGEVVFRKAFAAEPEGDIGEVSGDVDGMV